MPFETEHLTPMIGAGSDLPFRLTSVGLFQSFGNFRWQLVSWRYALHLIHDGSGVFVENGQVVEIGPGDAILQRPGRHYRYFDQPGQPWRYDFLTMEGEIDLALMPKEGKFTPSPALLEIAREATRLYRADQVPIAQAARLGWALVEAMSPPAPENAEPDLVDVLSAIANRSDTVLPTVIQIADQLGMDRTTLYRQFRDRSGGALKPWLDGIRMGRAEELLLHSDAPIREIAEICGFRDPLYFSRAFRKAHAVPPGAWRKRVRSQPM